MGRRKQVPPLHGAQAEEQQQQQDSALWEDP